MQQMQLSLYCWYQHLFEGGERCSRRAVPDAEEGTPDYSEPSVPQRHPQWVRVPAASRSGTAST